MANKKKYSSKSKFRRKVKPIATDEQIRDMAKRYRESYVGETPYDIYTRRSGVHEEMSKYSNQQEIYDALNNYETKYNVSSNPESGMVLTPFKDIFPGYQPTYDNGNVSGFEVIPNFSQVPNGYTAVIGDQQSNNTDNIFAPDFKSTYVWYKKDEPSLEEEDSSLNDLSSTYLYEPSAAYVQPELEESPIDNIVDNTVNDTINTNEEILANYSFDNDYFPTTLNRSVYAPRVSSPSDFEPELNDEEYARVYENRTPSTSQAREKVRLPEEIFANMTSLNKIMHDMQDIQRRRSYGSLTPQVVNLQNYAYEQLHPTYILPHPLTYDQWLMHPVTYPYIPQLGFFFNPKIRKYVYVKN